MNCDTAQDLMLDHVEGELDEAQSSELDTHISQCPDCKLAVLQTRELLGAMHDIKSKQERASHASSFRRSQGFAAELTSWDEGQRLGDFEILGEIGRGGMGIVYRARQVSLNRLVALKVLPGIFRQVPTAVTRFQKEAQAAAKLHHTNIVPVYAQGEFEGHFYYAMELVDGESLDHIIKRDPSRIIQSLCGAKDSSGALPAGHESGVTSGHTMMGRRGGYRLVARLIAGVAEGLDHAHSQGVIHRDIKPQNLLRALDGQLHITDFGLARLLDEPSITLTGEMVGTPAYMSPEQITGDRKAIDHRTDIYSLGVTFYEILTGQRPFGGITREQVVSRIMTREPRPPRKLNPGVPIDLETICLRAMEKERARRYRSAGEMAADLRRYADDRPIFSRRATIIERTVKWVRRHPALTAIYVLSFILVAGATSWTVQAIRARHARANDLVREAYDLLAFEDYHESARALTKLEAALPLGPDQWSYRRALGLAYLATNKDRAIEHLTWAVQQRPDDTTTTYILAWALRQQAGRVDASAKRWLDKADTLGGATTAEAHFFRGQVLVKQEDEAEEEYRRARLMRPNYTQALIHLGRALNYWMYHYRKHDKYHEQLQCLDAVCMVHSDRGYPFYLRSLAHRLSAEIYREAENPAEAQEAEREFALALMDARKAQEVQPNNPLCYFAEAEYWDVRRNYSRALAVRLQSEPYCVERERRAELLQYRWRLYWWTSKYEDALHDLDELAALRENSDPMRTWYVGLFPSVIAAEQGRVEDAIALSRKMAQVYPRSFRAITSAACMLRLLGHVDEADQLLADHATQLEFRPSAEAEISPDFMRAAYEFCRHRRSRDAVLKAAPATQRQRLTRAVPSFLEGLDALAAGDRQEATRLLRESDTAYDSEDYCYAARVLARRMEADPRWPSWVRKP